MGRLLCKFGVLGIAAVLISCGVSEISPSDHHEHVGGSNVALPGDDPTNTPVQTPPTGTEKFAIGGSTSPIVTRLGNSIAVNFSITAAGAPVTVNLSTDFSSVTNNVNPATGLATVSGTVSPTSISLAANETKMVTVTLITGYDAAPAANTKFSLIGSESTSVFSNKADQALTIASEVRFINTAPTIWDINSPPYNGVVGIRASTTNLDVYLVNMSGADHQFHVTSPYHSSVITKNGEAYKFTVPTFPTAIGWYYHGEGTQSDQAKAIKN